MRRFTTVCAVVLALSLGMSSGTVRAAVQETPSAVVLRQGLTGIWEGALGYRDYQTDRLFELPVRTTIEAVGDGVTLIQTSRFDDGPGKVVWITTTSLDDPVAGTTTSASFRAGNAVEPATETLRVQTYVDADHWTIIYSGTGSDDDAPADIRIIETRDGPGLLSIKEVRPVGGDDTAWRFRNQTRLTRIDD